MGDRALMVRLLGQKVAVKLTNVEARSVEIIATLEEVRDGGIVLSEIGELGPRTDLVLSVGLSRAGHRPATVALDAARRTETGESTAGAGILRAEGSHRRGGRAGAARRATGGLGEEPAARRADRAATDHR